MTLPAPNPSGRPSVTAKLLIDLRNCLAAQLADTVSGRAGRVYLAHDQGVPVMDGCVCDTRMPDGTSANGDAWVRLVNETRAILGGGGFGVAPVGGLDCGLALNLTIELGIMRCHPLPDPPPLSAAVTNDLALVRLSDKDALWRVISPECCRVLFEDLHETPILTAAWTPLGPNGNCSGSILTIQVERPYNYTC